MTATLHIRWAIKRDTADVLPLIGWDEDEYEEFLRERANIGVVVEQGEKVVGAALYELYKQGIRVHALAGDQAGKERLVASLVNKLSISRRSRLQLPCDLADTQFADFLRKEGFGLHCVVGDTLTFHKFKG